MKKHRRNLSVTSEKNIVPSRITQHKVYDIAVIGGGVTGLGIARKAAAQGFSVIVIERDEIGSGASGNFHELVHSGVRYAVGDPSSAKECYEENTFLTSKNSLVKEAIKRTGGLFLAVTAKDEEYAEILISACRKINLPIEEMNVGKIALEEKNITKALRRVFRVPDAHVDGKKVLQINQTIAVNYGATILIHHKVIGFRKRDDRIETVNVRNSIGEEKEISCGFVINAAGAWAGQVSLLAGIESTLIPYKGILIVFKEKLHNYVLNHCRKPSNGDIFVPADGHTILGTTSERIKNIDTVNVTKNEIASLLYEGEKVIPGLSSKSITKVYAGIRPLYAPSLKEIDGRKISRSFMIINHKINNIKNFISVVGGKFMLYERMSDAALEVVNKNFKN